MILRIKRLDLDLPLPSYAHPGDAGLDLFAAEDVILAPGARALVRTAVAVAIPDGYAGFVQPRSGRALSEGLTLANAPGLIDSAYRGEIMVVAMNADRDTPISIRRGDRIAQLVVQRVERMVLEEADELDETRRGDGGFGSTGHR